MGNSNLIKKHPSQRVIYGMNKDLKNEATGEPVTLGFKEPLAEGLDKGKLDSPLKLTVYCEKSVIYDQDRAMIFKSN